MLGGTLRAKYARGEAHFYDVPNCFFDQGEETAGSFS